MVECVCVRLILMFCARNVFSVSSFWSDEHGVGLWHHFACISALEQIVIKRNADVVAAPSTTFEYWGLSPLISVP
jgi:hypothetical protein